MTHRGACYKLNEKKKEKSSTVTNTVLLQLSVHGQEFTDWVLIP